MSVMMEPAPGGASPIAMLIYLITPLDVHDTRAVPRVVTLIKVAATVPELSPVCNVIVSLLLENEPRVVLKVAEVPIKTALPALSINVAVMIVEETPSAAIDVEEADSVIDDV